MRCILIFILFFYMYVININLKGEFFMKKHIKEIIILFMQLCLFYLFPLTWGPTDAMGGVLLMLLATIILSLILGLISTNKIKFLHPLAIAIAFIPTIFIYYNSSASIHAVWYLVASSIGLAIGFIFRFIFKKGKSV